MQRVCRAHVEVAGRIVGKIQEGLCIFVAAGKEDTETDSEYVVTKVCGLRIFPDKEGKMNHSILETKGSILAISQFTLYGDIRKGRRPAFQGAMPAEMAKLRYHNFCDALRKRGVIKVETGVFQADMRVDLVNDGPVTILIDSKKTF